MEAAEDPRSVRSKIEGSWIGAVVLSDAVIMFLYWNWIWPYLVEQGVLILEMWDVPRGPGRYHFNDTATNRPHIRWAAVVLASKYLWRSKCDCALHLSLELSRNRVVDYDIVTMFSCFLEATTHSCCGAKVWGRSHMTSGIDVGIFGPLSPLSLIRTIVTLRATPSPSLCGHHMWMPPCYLKSETSLGAIQ